jgi:hypothetical protein
MSNLFQKLELEAFRAGINPRTEQSRDWFRKRVANLKRINRESLMREGAIKRRNAETVGAMCMFFYDPKTKDTLPYYDTFPLVIVVGPAEGGFYGLNLHYLPPILRAKMLDKLLEYTNNKSYDDTTKFKLKYSLLNSVAALSYYKPCFKHYLNSHVKSQFGIVEAPEWEIATFMPTSIFKKASTSRVYADSRRM